MINFYLPNFYQRNFLNLNIFFSNQLQNNPQYFYKDIKIGALYGSFPDVLWNGGRIMNGEVYLSEVRDTIQIVNSQNIPVRFTYTNSLIKEEHLDDVYANVITQLGDNGKNEILVNSPILEKYLREKFPSYKFLSSTTKCLLDEEAILAEQDKYYLTVLDYRKNHDFEFLKKVNPEKIELLINPYCHVNCPIRELHYQKLAEGQINGTFVDELPGCVSINSFRESLEESEALIKVEDLYGIYSDMGFKHFKIEGRTESIIDVLESYLYYMVLPEHIDRMRTMSLKVLF